MDNTKDINQLSPLQRAALALKEMRVKLDAAERSKNEPIAIVGMNCRFPNGADDPDKFWELLQNGIDAVIEVPADRWNIDDYYDKNPMTPGKMYARYGAFIQQVDQFDPHFFGISPKEANSMDPQQRLLLEVAWSALENAGQSPEKLNGSQTGVFMGLFMDDYSRLNLYSGDPNLIDGYSSLGNARSIAVGRLAHTLGLQGPVMQLDTACSSSLLAVHLACQSLRSGECNLALAGGVNLILSPEASVGLSKMRALAPDGRCKTFDAAADGYGRGEGCGIVVLKRLSDAIANNDNILGLVRGSAVNHDGKSSGLTVPNGLAQEALIKQALRNAQVEPLEISYVETHGTGTSLGDPIEVGALGSVLCDGRSPEQPLFIGSVKSQIGHLESAAGVASLMKVILALQHVQIPPNLHLKQPTPRILWDKLAVKVPTQLVKWDSHTQQRLAGVSSFGISGTNVHVVVESAPEIIPPHPEVERPVHLLCLSAKTETALLSLASRYETFLTTNPAASLANICFTANTGRSHFSHRLVIAAESTAQLHKQLGKLQASKLAKIGNNRPRIVFMFTGQGSQYVGMARQLYETQPTFRKTLDKCDEILRPYLEKPLLSVIYPEPNAPQILHETAYTQPALFALEYALAQMWKSWGIIPDAVMGHSVGEYVAACVAGVFSLEDGLKLIAERGRLIQSLPQNGMMAAVFASEAKITSVLEQGYVDTVAIATINGPENVVISGLRSAVSEVLEKLKLQGINAQPLQVSHAFHSPLMAGILDNFERVANTVKFQPPDIAFVSNLTGQMWDSRQIPDANYWRQHLREAVRFFTGIETVHKQGYEIFVEIGPSSTLLGMGKRCLEDGVGTWLSSLKKGQSDWTQLLASLGELYLHGVTVDWTAFDKDYLRRRMALPTYPFERQRYWVENKDISNNPKPKPIAIAPAKISAPVPKDWFYTWKWCPEISAKSQEIPTGAILIFGDCYEVGEQFSKLLDTPSSFVYFITSGESFEKQEEGCFTINPGCSQDYEQLIQAVKAEGFAVTTALHLWNYKQQGSINDNDGSQNQNQSLWSVLSLVKAITKYYPNNRLNLLLLTQGAYVTSVDETLQNSQQSMAGTIAQVLAQENPTIQTKVVDVTLEVLPRELADILLQELKTSPTSEGIVTIRNGQRLTRTLEKIDVSTSSDELQLLDGDTWLITGGTSGVGTEIAYTLARLAAVNLVLTGRHPLPPKQEWESAELDTPTIERIQTIQKLERLGATVMYQAVDVTDRLGMQQLVQTIKSRFGQLNGVIHAAGVADNTTFKLLQKQNNAIAKVLAPKVEGTIILDDVTRNEPLKYFVVLSSVSASKAEWGTGMGDYAAANTFLDSYIVHRSQSVAPGRSLALNYSLWSNRGMGVLLGESTLLMVKSKGLNPLEPELAANAFIKALCLDASPVVHIIDLIAQVPETPPIPTVKPHAKTQSLHHLVREILVQHLTVSEQQLEGYKTFQELGLDSVGTVEVVQSLGKALGAELFPTLLYEYQTPDNLITYLQEKYGYNVKAENSISSPAVTINSVSAKYDVKEQDIAIIGMACKVPGASDLEQYWNLLSEGRDAIQDVPTDRWFNQHYFAGDNTSSQPQTFKRGCFVEHPFDFDSMYFGISPREATAMDPQQRLFLELAMQALQQAGYGGRYKDQDIGVFVGCGQNTYIEHFTNYQYYEALRQRLCDSSWFKTLSTGEQQHLLDTLSTVLQPSEILPESAAGNEVNELAARVSHCLDLKGPSMAVSTACSSSLVALHIACENIRSGQTRMAIVGGVNLNLSPSPFTFLKKAQALSPTGTCYPFDKRANGMILGEGAGVLIIKPLQQALADGDLIHAVIKGSAINNDGHSQGITAPNPRGQAEAIRKAYKNCDIDPITISYIETHGTGTLLGDPVEVEGMTQAFRSFTDKKGFCAIGSVKSSIGHLLSASGVVSLIKVVLAMKHGKIPQTLGFSEANPHINFTDTPFYVVGGENKPWSRTESPLRAGINGFGFGGTNCHVILEESPLASTNSSQPEVKNSSGQLLFLTARNQQVLKEVAGQLHEHIIKNPEQQVAQICFTANNAQRELPYKAALLVNDRQHLLDKLLAISENEITSDNQIDIHIGRANPKRTTPLHLVLDENISITPEEVEILRNQFPEFHQACIYCENYWTEPTLKLTGQAYKFTVQYAWGRLLMFLELQPTSLLVEKIGILSGACLCGMLTLQQAIMLISQQQKGIINDVTPQDKLVSTWNSPLVTPKGILRNSEQLTVSEFRNILQSSERLNVENYREIINPESVYVHLDNFSPVQQQIASLDKLGIWINLHKEQLIVNRILTSLAKLYVAGVSFNSAGLFPQGLRRVQLPTYPFERKTFRVELAQSTVQENTDSNSGSGNNRLLLIESPSPLTAEQRQLSYLALSENFKG
jgi:acyl transferase domain-containing protein/NAD(P)-dependent dehydrogenase (short-subunit alcohol dehydrogenase family)/acyl carrier protein